MIPNKTILAASLNEKVIMEIENTFKNDGNISIIMVLSGKKLIGRCLQTIPDLIILDYSFFQDRISDNSFEMIITIIKCLEELQNTKIMLVSDIKNKLPLEMVDVDAHLYLSDFNQETLREKVLALINIPIQISTPTSNRRKWPRANVGIPAQIEYVLSDSISVVHKKDGIIQDISVGGLCLFLKEQLDDLKLKKDDKVVLSTNTYPLTHWKSLSQVVRPQKNSYGLSFMKISNMNLEKIREFFHA